MMLFSRRWHELDAVSPRVARELVDTLFHQTAPVVVAAGAFILLGMTGFIGNGSPWYLVGAALSGLTCAWRLMQIHLYGHSRDRASPQEWVKRNIPIAWLTAAIWGAWSLTVLYEADRALVIMVVGAQSACVIGGAVRNCAVRIVAEGQAFLTLVPLFVMCLASGNGYLQLYAAFIVMHLYAALAMTTFLHRQTVQLLVQAEEKSALLARLEQANADLEFANAHLARLAATDSLTGVANRRAFDAAISNEWRRCARERAHLSLLLLDIDHFKAFNDFYGHPAGDDCLRTVASVIASVLRRSGDVLARFGGEEFAIILPHTDEAGAVQMSEKIQYAMTSRLLPHDASPVGHLTLSIGIACLVPDPCESVDRLTARADAALYAAKRGGRSRVHLAETIELTPGQPTVTDGNSVAG